MTEIFNDISVIGDAINNEDRVVHLLSSLLNFNNMLVTALEVNPAVSEMEVVTGRLLHEEFKR